MVGQNRKHQVEFIDTWYQNGKPREGYFLMNGIYLLVGLFLFSIWTDMEFQRGLGQHGYMI